MKCEQCVKEGKKSKVFIGPTKVLAVYRPSYYDEDGNLVIQSSPSITEYNCSNGHTWEENS